MNKMYLGKLVNTHGIKGEVRIKSDVENKNDFFKVGNELIINNDLLTINSYRVHKGYDMVTFKEINDIDEVLKYKGLNVFIDRDKVTLSNTDYILNDLIDFDIICNEKKYGKIKDFMYNSTNCLLVIDYDNKQFYIPYNEVYIINVDLNNKQVVTKDIEGLII